MDKSIQLLCPYCGYNDFEIISSENYKCNSCGCQITRNELLNKNEDLIKSFGDEIETKIPTGFLVNVDYNNISFCENIKLPISITHFGITITITKIDKNKEIEHYDEKIKRIEIEFIIKNNSNTTFHYSSHDFQIVDLYGFAYKSGYLISKDSWKFQDSFEIQSGTKYRGVCQFEPLKDNVPIKALIYKRSVSYLPFSFRFYFNDYTQTQKNDLDIICANQINKLYNIAETYSNKSLQDFESELFYAKKQAEYLIEDLSTEKKELYTLRLSVVWAEIEHFLESKKTTKYTTRRSSYQDHRVNEFGTREDLGEIEFRSSWEANIARILNKKQIKWKYEKQHFQLGDTPYLPDFFLDDGTILEVKGFWDNDSITKCDMFIRSYPEINYLILDSDMYYDINVLYTKYSPLPYWENSTVSKRSEPVAVVGISFLQDKSVLNELKIGTILELEMESNNEYDKFAIAVKTNDGKYVGHIEKKFASIYTQKMKLGMKFNAEIESIEKKVIKVKVKRTNYDSCCIVYDILKN